MNSNKFPSFSFMKRLRTMMKVDFRRMLQMPLYYIILGSALIIPILIFVMTTLMAGTETIDQVTKEPTVMPQMFTNFWQIIGSVTTTNTEPTMDITTMCNINMMYFAIAVFLCIFISDDFRSGYAKNLFTVRASKIDYVISKTIVGFVSGITIIVAFFVGAIIGAVISNLSFELVGFFITNAVMCMVAKIFISLVFVPIFVVMSVLGKQRTWLSLILAFGASMLLYMMVASIAPLDSTIINVILSLVGGLLFSVGLGAISNLILKKTSLV